MKNLQLILIKPCQENWEEMQPSKAGRFCEKCAKHVVDLTTKTDRELIDFFKSKKDNVCGKLLNTQLRRDLLAPPQKSNWQWLITVALSATFFAPTVAKAQLKANIIQNDKSLSLKPVLSNTSKNLEFLKGKVVDQASGKPLSGVKISQKGFKNTIAQTDTNGNYTINLSVEQKIYPLVFTLPNYNSVEQAVGANMEVKLSKSPQILIGGLRSVNRTNQPLYVVYAGNEQCYFNNQKDFNQIKPEWIAKVEVLKDANATAIYGTKTVNGVILIEIKKKYATMIDFSKKQ